MVSVYMNRSQISEFCNERGSELLDLGRLLFRHKVILDQGPLGDAAKECRRWAGDKEGRWRYNLDGLKFSSKLNSTQLLEGARPVNATAPELFTIELTVSLSGQCRMEDDLCDPFDKLAADFFVEGLTDDGERVCSAWHLDRHIHNEGDNEPVAVHPIYHFHYGGRRIEDLPHYGNLLMIEAPRVNHPPLDAILAIDFILSNYCGETWKKIRNEESRYGEIIKSAQNRCWRPYAIATAAWWNSPYDNHEWHPQIIWPQL